MKFIEVAKDWLKQILDLGVMLIAVAVVLQLLFGVAVPFVGGDVVANIIKLVSALGSEGLVGLVAIGILFWAFNKK